MMLNGVDLPAEEAVRRGYEELRQETERAVSAKLRGRGVHVDPADLDALYNQAWHALYTRLAEGEEVENPTGFLVQVMFFRGVDEFRRLRPGQRADSVDTETLADNADPDQAIDDRHRIRSFVEGMKDRLTERESQAAALCYLQGFSRPEAASVLGLSEKRMQKLMDAVSKKVGIFAQEISSGAWCESRDSLMKAYALGLLDPEGERYRLAAVHLRGCAGCRRRVLALRGIAAIVPPVALPWTLLGAGGAGAAGGSTAAGSGALAGGAGAAPGAVVAGPPGGTIAVGNPGGIAASTGGTGPAGGAPAPAGTAAGPAGGGPAAPEITGSAASPGGSVGAPGGSRLSRLTPRSTATVAVAAVAVVVAAAAFASMRGGEPDTPVGSPPSVAGGASQGAGGAGGAGAGGAGAGGQGAAAPAASPGSAAGADDTPPAAGRDQKRADDGKQGDSQDEPPAKATTVPDPPPAAVPAPPPVQPVAPVAPVTPAPSRDTGDPKGSAGAKGPDRTKGNGTTDTRPGTKDSGSGPAGASGGGSVADDPPLEDGAQEFGLAP